MASWSVEEGRISGPNEEGFSGLQVSYPHSQSPDPRTTASIFTPHSPSSEPPSSHATQASEPPSSHPLGLQSHLLHTPLSLQSHLSHSTQSLAPLRRAAAGRAQR